MAKKLIKAILADLDGTINRGSLLIEGARETYETLKRKGVKWVLISNSARRLAKDLAAKVNRLGLDVSNDQVINSASALLNEINRNRKGSRVFAIGEPPLIAGLRNVGAEVNLHNDEGVEIVIVAMDSGFHYGKLKSAYQALSNGALFWATNLDPTYPLEGGFVPGAGSIVASVTTAIGRAPDKVFGKPEQDMALLALERLNMSPEECLVVGDRMDTDILFARNVGMYSALVLTGATSLQDLSQYDFRPHYIFESIRDIQQLFS
jgi:HAD superfamily hydrolase (TIGR01450 family)